MSVSKSGCVGALLGRVFYILRVYDNLSVSGYPFSNLGRTEKQLYCLLIKGNDNLLTFTEHFPCVMQTLCKVPSGYSHVILGGKTACFCAYVALLKES